ncbi:fatty acid desaturase [Nocardia arthritidis]|uniref:Fatty acid desaturase n=1 Tax=Nocardia arthritidis TaxID=228602 RepID=A0A6G9YFM0_9NOCA|nr:fatty acid desaturase [Nocardia arthritidis]
MTEISAADRTSDRRAGGRGRSINLWLFGVAVAAGLLQLIVLPVFLLPRSAAWGWILVPLVLLTTPFWSLIHEAIHGMLVSRREVNDRCGRVLGVLYGSPFALLKAGHLLHHRFSRVRDRGEIYDPATSSWGRAAFGYYLRLLGGLYLLEVVAVLLAPLPAPVLRRLAERLDAPDSVAGPLFERLAQPRALGRFRTDAVAIVALYAVAFACYGGRGWMLLAAIGGRALIISLSDNAYHYGTELDRPLEAMNLRLPRVLERFALSFNLHGVHHRHPGLRWYELRAAFRREGGRYHLGWFTAAARQLRGPIALR